MKKHIPKFDEFPVRVTLCFQGQADRDEFMGGLSDGFGENWCQLDWESTRPDDPHQPSEGFEAAQMFTVIPMNPEL